MECSEFSILTLFIFIESPPRSNKSPPDLLSEYKDEFGSLGAYLHAAVLRLRAAAGQQQRILAPQAAAAVATASPAATGQQVARPVLSAQSSLSSEPGTPTVLQQQPQQRIFLVGAQQPPH